MKAILKVSYEETATPYGHVKRQYWRCSKCNKRYTKKYGMKNCINCGAELEREPVKTWLD